MISMAFVKLVNKSVSPTRWYEGLAHYQQNGTPHVLATVVAVNGSAPRALQAKMIVTKDSICDTLGGGGLEHDVTITARQLLAGDIAAVTKKTRTKEAKKSITNEASSSEDRGSTPAKSVRRESIYTKHYPLGAKLAQCCGGSVTVMFECFNAKPPLSLLVFGAGHVATALMTILADLPCQVDWVDSRAEMFVRHANDDATDSQLPAHIRTHVSEDPVDFVAPFIEEGMSQKSQRFILVMTHDHALDFDLVRAAVDVSTSEMPDTSAPYIGCIGSATKADRFQNRLRQRGYSEQAVDLVTMPIGLPIGGKEPMAVAVSIVAQLLRMHHQQNDTD